MNASLKVSLWLPGILLACLCLASTGAVAKKVGGITLDEQTTAGDAQLVLNGAGIRKKLFFKLYVGSLYVADELQGSSADDIVMADAPMLIQLNVLSDLLTRDKLVNALNDGFRKSTGGNTAPIESQITAMRDSMSSAVRPGDVYQLVYEPQLGTHIVRADETIATIPGLPFKQALFGIWLSASPAQASLKQAMLSGGS